MLNRYCLVDHFPSFFEQFGVAALVSYSKDFEILVEKYKWLG